MADLSDSVNWSEVDASNNKASPLGWPEGMMPSGVNDSARADKGALKRFWDRINPVQGIAPVGGVWTFTTSNPVYPAAYVDGEVYCFMPLADSAGGDQFRVNALAAKPIWKRIDIIPSLVPIGGIDIVGRKPATLVYDSTLNGGAGAFMLVDPFVPLTGDGAGGITVAGPIYTTGGSAAFSFAARDGAAPTSWIWYATGGMARLNAAGSGDRVWVDAAGSLSAAGYLTAGSNIYSGNDLHLAGDFILFAGNASLTSGPLIEGTTADFFTRLGPGNGGWYWQNSGGANVMTLTSGGALTAASPIYTTGANAALVFYDRTDSAASWAWYATGGAARLNLFGGADRIIVDSASIHLAGHVYGGGNLYLTGALIQFSGVTAGGPYINADGTNMSFALGPSNGGFYFDKSDGTNVARIDAGGNIYGWDIHAGGTLTAQYVNASANITAPGIHSTGNVQADGQFVGGLVSVTGNITSTTGTVTGAFIRSTGNVQADGAFTGGSVSVSGTVTGAYIHSTGNVQADGALTGGSVSVSGTINGGITTGVEFHGANYFIGVQGASQAGTFGFANGNGPGLVCWGTTSSGAGALQITIGGIVKSTVYSGGLNVVGDISASGNLFGQNLLLAANAIFFNGNTSTAHGPFIFADASDLIFNIGSNAGAWRFENNSRTQVALIDANGEVYGAAYRGTGGGAGYLRGIPTADPTVHNIALGWDNVGGKFYMNNDGATTRVVPWSTLIRGLQLTSTAGTPSGWQVSAYDDTSSYTMYCDFTSSDARLKSDIADSEVDALAALLAVPVRRFEWLPEIQKTFGRPQPPVKIGLVAQDMLPHMPDCVGISEDRGDPFPDDTHTIMHDRIDAYLIRAIQQLEARVAQLEAQ